MKNHLTLANRISILRIILIPLFIIGLLEGYTIWPAIIFIFCALTDILDGALARWRGEKTVLGSFLDPVADKLLLGATYLTLAHLRLVPMWAFVVVFSRDLLILIGWNIIYILTQDSTLTPRWLGKTTTLFEMLTVILFLLIPFNPVVPVFFWLTIAVTAASTVDYVWVGAKKLSQLDAGLSFAE